MFNYFKKQISHSSQEEVMKDENVSLKSDSIFPNATQIFEATSQHWKHVTPEEVLEKIIERAASGKRSVFFNDSYISDTLVKELEKQGYTVLVGNSIHTLPYFRVSW